MAQEVDYKRVFYCLKKWVEECRDDLEPVDEYQKRAFAWLIMTCDNEIFNGEYLEDKEYNEMLIEDTGGYSDRL